MSIERVWEDEWQRNDFCAKMVKALPRRAVKGVMEAIGRSHRDAYRWAELADWWPEDLRRQDRAPREHSRIRKLFVPQGVEQANEDVLDYWFEEDRGA